MVLSQDATIITVTNTLLNTFLQTGRPVCFTVTTTSMMPLIKPGDQVIVEAVSQDQWRLGDIALIRLGDAWLVHRLIDRQIKVDKEFWLTKGDNVPSADRLWSNDELHGIMILVQKTDCRLDLRLRRIRIANFALSVISRLENRVFLSLPHFFHGVFLKGLRISSYMIVQLVLVRESFS